MFCTHCGKPLEEGLHFCPYCGSRETASLKTEEGGTGAVPAAPLAADAIPAPGNSAKVPAPGSASREASLLSSGENPSPREEPSYPDTFSREQIRRLYAYGPVLPGSGSRAAAGSKGSEPSEVSGKSGDGNGPEAGRGSLPSGETGEPVKKTEDKDTGREGKPEPRQEPGADALLPAIPPSPFSREERLEEELYLTGGSRPVEMEPFVPEQRPPEEESAPREASRKKQAGTGIFLLIGALFLAAPSLYGLLFPTEYQLLPSSPDLYAAVSIVRSCFSFLDTLVLGPLSLLALAGPAVLLIRSEGSRRGLLLSAWAEILGGVYLLAMIPISLSPGTLQGMARLFASSAEEHLLPYLTSVLWLPGANLGVHYLALLPLAVLCLIAGISMLLCGRNAKKSGEPFPGGRLPRGVLTLTAGGALMAFFLTFQTTLDQLFLVRLTDVSRTAAFSLVKSFWTSPFLGGLYRLPLPLLLFLCGLFCLLARKLRFSRLALPGAAGILLYSGLLAGFGYPRYLDYLQNTGFSQSVLDSLGFLYWADAVGYMLAALGLYLWMAASAKGCFPLWVQLPLVCLVLTAGGALSWFLMASLHISCTCMLAIAGVLLTLISCIFGFLRHPEEKQGRGRPSPAYPEETSLPN